MYCGTVVPEGGLSGIFLRLEGGLQDGALDFLLARLSKGPVTNLHLNNHPLEASRLALPEDVTSTIQELCRRPAAVTPAFAAPGSIFSWKKAA